MKTRRTLLSVIGMSFLSCMSVRAQSKSKKSKSRKSEKSLPMKRTFNVFGYTLGTKITEWKDVERLTDKKYKDDFVDCYSIQNPSFSSTFKDYDNVVHVQKSTSLTYKIEFIKSIENPSTDDIEMLEKSWQTLKAGLVTKYKDPELGSSIYESGTHMDKWRLESDNLVINLSFIKTFAGSYFVKVTYSLSSIELIVESDKSINFASKRLGIDLSKDSKKKTSDLSKEIP
jgi:hypothetical protein